MNSFFDGAKYSSPLLNGLHCSEFTWSGLLMSLDSKLDEPHALISNPRFFAYQSFVSFGLSVKKKMPPMPVTLGVDVSVFLSSMYLIVLCQVANISTVPIQMEFYER